MVETEQAARDHVRRSTASPEWDFAVHYPLCWLGYAGKPWSVPAMKNTGTDDLIQRSRELRAAAARAVSELMDLRVRIEHAWAEAARRKP